MRFKGENIMSAVVGGLVVALIMMAMPAMATNGDTLILGQKNTARNATKIISSNATQLHNVKPNRPALSLTVRSGAPPLKVNSAALVDNLNADLLDGWEANSLVRAAFCTTADAADNVDYSCAMTIVAPTNGILIMSGSVDFWTSTPGGDLLSCMFKKGVNEITGSRRDIDIQNPGNQESDCATDAAMYVTAGSHEITFTTSSVGLNTNLGSVGAYVLYVPFGGTGFVPEP